MRAVYRLEALADLNSHLSHIASNNPSAASRVADRIGSAISRLEMFPYSGRAGTVPGTYELVVSKLPNVAVYRVAEYVGIIAVFHAAQDREKGLTR